MATPLTTAQLNNAKRIVEIGKQRRMSERDILTALSVAWVESKLKNYANSNVPESLGITHDAVGSDHDSVGVFQQRVMYWGKPSDLMNLNSAANKFFDALAALGSRTSMSIGQAAQAVQKSAFPDRYDEQLPIAREIYARVQNGSPGIDVDAYDEYKERNPGIVTPLQWVSTPDNWKRIGFFALGAFLIIFVVYSLLADSPVTKAAIKAAL